MKIGNKLLITYFILLIIVFVVTGITFRALLQRYLISEARTVIRTEAQAIADALEKIPISDGKIRPNLVAKREMRVLGQFIDSSVIIVNNSKKVIYSDVEETDRGILQAVISRNKLDKRQYVTEKVPIVSQNGEVKGQVFVFARIKNVNKLGRMMNRTQLTSLIAGGAAAVILAMVFQTRLTKPIRKLKDYMAGFSLKDSRQKPDIRTGDEIEELAECFSGMVQKLRQYDEQQKIFLQNTSHELKTPLMSIQGYAEAIKDGIVEGKEMEESLDVIIDESKRLKKIVDEIIYLVKLDNVDEAFHFERTSIQEIINQSVKSVKALFDAGGIRLKIEGDCSYEGSFDKEKLSRAIINILSNGVRYAEKEISINCEARENHLEITITDDGKGFQNGEESKIFERFYKGEKGGTGIGLAIAKAIITGHNGRIEAYNAVSGGAVFKIILPGRQES